MNKIFMKDRKFNVKLIILIVLVIGQSIFTPLAAFAAGSTTLSLSPQNGAYNVGQSLTITIYENSGTTAVNAVQADFTYPQNELSFSSANFNSSAFEIAAPSTESAGSVSINRGTTNNNLTGNQIVGSLTFSVTAAGNASLNFENSSAVVSTANNTNTIGTMNNGQYTLKTNNVSSVANTTASPNNYISPSASSYGATTGRTPVIPPSPANSVSIPSNIAASSSSPSSASFSTPAKPSLIVTPAQTSTNVNLPTNSSLELNNSATIKPVNPSPSSPIVKTEYYLNNKLIATVYKPPFNYYLDTHNMLNGNYNLTAVSYHQDGSKSTSNHKLIVTNPASLNQIRLALMKYIVPMIIALVAVLIFIGFLFRDNAKYILKNVWNWFTYNYEGHNRKMTTLSSGINNLTVPLSHPGEVITPSSDEHKQS